MEQLTIQQIIDATNGIIKEITLTDIIQHVTIDSRNLKKNSLFIAIKGSQNDGHDYVAKVLEDRTNYALVNKDFALDLPNLIRVHDTTIGLGMISAYYRQQFKIPVVAITGSNGKTTVKEMLRSICNEEFGDQHVLATSGNLNNHWGMPLTLLELNHCHKVAIIEMGMNHSGELDYLSKLAKPTIAVVNNVMFAHAGHFNSLADIANAKGEIYHGLPNDGIACVNLASDFASAWITKDINCNSTYSFGTTTSKCFIEDINDNGAIFNTARGKIQIKLNILGRHNYDNALTAIALALNLNCSITSIKNGLENYSGYKGRLEQKIAFNGALIVDDTYNANPDSVKAALESIQTLPRQHWFIFGDLKELGENESLFHKEIGEVANKYNIDKLITVGTLSKITSEYFTGDKIHFDKNEDVVKYCLSHLPINATLLIKGSNSMRLFDVAKHLTKE